MYASAFTWSQENEILTCHDAFISGDKICSNLCNNCINYLNLMIYINLMIKRKMQREMGQKTGEEGTTHVLTWKVGEQKALSSTKWKNFPLLPSNEDPQRNDCNADIIQKKKKNINIAKIIEHKLYFFAKRLTRLAEKRLCC